MSNRDSQCIDTGFIATGKRQRGNNYLTNNEVEDDFLNTQGENSPISTQPNLHFAQEPPPSQPSISASRREETQLICASIEKKSDRTAIHNEEFSVSAAVKTFQQLQGFSKGDNVFAITMFMDNARVREAFLSCNEETRAPLIKAIIDQHKPKQKRPWVEHEQDASKNHPQSSQVQVISSMKNGQKRQYWEDADPNHQWNGVSVVRVISSVENGQKREYWEDADQNQPQSSRMRTTSSYTCVVLGAVMKTLFGNSSSKSKIMRNKVHDEVLFTTEILGMRISYLSRNHQNRQYYKEEAVPALRTQPLHIEELPTHKLVFANKVPQSIFTGNNIIDNDKRPIEIQLRDINTGNIWTNLEDSPIKVKIVVIDGDLELEGLDSAKFSSKIAKERDDKRPLLFGNTEVTLNQGVGTIGDIYFTDNSKWQRSGKFRLGACIGSKRCGTIINIQEGLSEKFKVKDQRGLLYEKHYPPMLNDNVWRLETIAKDGKYHQRLKDKGINSVQDFLKLWNANPSVLEEILKMPINTWNKVVKHAQTCPMELDNANLENNANLQKSPGLEPFTLPNPMPGVQPENMEPGMIETNGELPVEHVEIFVSGQDTYVSNQRENIFITDPLLNVPEPNASMLHAPQSWAQYMVMEQQRDPAAHFGSDQMEHVQPISSLNGNNGSLGEAVEEMPEQPSTGQGMTMDNDISIDDYMSSGEEQRDPAVHFGSDQMEHVHPISSLNGNNGPNENFKGMSEDATEIPDLGGLKLPDLAWLENNLRDGEIDLYAFFDGGSTSN